MQANHDPTEHWYTPEFFADPYPYFESLRRHEPVYWSPTLNGWVVTGYEQVNSMLRQPRIFSSVGRMGALLNDLPEDERNHFKPIYDHFSVGMIRSDPPDHSRLRRLISAAFTPRVVQQSRDTIQAIADSLIKQLPNDEQVDLLKEFAYPLPATLICSLLGVPEDDLERIRNWAVGINSIITGTMPLREAAERTQESLLELQQYYRDLITQRRQSPKNDLMSLLVAAEDEGDKLTEAELLSTAENLLAAGHETTTSLIANGILTLLRHSGQLELLRQQEDLLPKAIEEIIRFESPLQRQTRVVKDDADFSGHSMRKGQIVFLMIGAANRDPTVFSNPDQFDIQRTENPHIAFGAGIHFCIGAPLARLEAELALRTLLQSFPDMTLGDDQIKWSKTAALRCPQSLEVHLGPRE